MFCIEFDETGTDFQGLAARALLIDQTCGLDESEYLPFEQLGDVGDFPRTWRGRYFQGETLLVLAKQVR